MRPEDLPGAWGILDLMARSIWTGAISFGLVTVPVKLYSAVNRKTVRFHQLSGKSGVRRETSVRPMSRGAGIE